DGIGQQGNVERYAFALGQPLLGLAAQIELHRLVHSVDSLVVPVRTRTAQDLATLPEAAARAILDHLGQGRDDLGIPYRPVHRRLVPRCPRQPNAITGPAQGPRVHLDQVPHGLALLLRPYSFFAIRSFIAALSSASSAYIRLSLAFSASRSLTRRSSEASKPPYFDLWGVCRSGELTAAPPSSGASLAKRAAALPRQALAVAPEAPSVSLQAPAISFETAPLADKATAMPQKGHQWRKNGCYCTATAINALPCAHPAARPASGTACVACLWSRAAVRDDPLGLGVPIDEEDPMKHPLAAALAVALAVAAPAYAQDAPMSETATATAPAGPFAAPSPLPLHYPQFDKIKDSDFAPAFDRGMAEQLAEVRAIADNPEPATFDNTIIALEKSGQLLDRATSVFFNLVGTDTNDARQKLRAEYAPKFSAHGDAIALDPALFARIKSLHEKQIGRAHV